MKDKIEVIKKLENNHKKSLESYVKSEVIEYVEILPAENSCEACKKMKGKKILLKKAVSDSPLPIKSCCNKKYGYCRCCYIPIVE